MKALAITTLLLFFGLGSVVGWFAFVGEPTAGEPRVVITLDDPGGVGAGAQAAPAGRASAATAGAAPETPAASPSSATETPPAESAPVESPPATPASIQPPPGLSVVGVNAPAAPDAALPVPPLDQAPAPPLPTSVAALPRDEPVRLGPVPLEALVQDSRYGPLPRIGPDGRQPSEAYARPTRHAALPQIGEPARVAVLINGMGMSETATADGIEKLPAPVSLAFGAYGRNLQSWVTRAREAGHEVLLQIPLEPFDYPDNDPGPHTLLTNLPVEENVKRLHWLMARFTGYAGVTNHMGGKFAASQEALAPVLEEIKSRGLIYVDDGGSARSAAAGIARQMGLGYAAAQIAIDVNPDPQAVDEALARLEARARETGFAVGVGSSIPVTFERVAEWARTLPEKGLVMVPVTAAVRAKHDS